MRMNKWLFPLIVVGLAVGCAKTAGPPLSPTSAPATPIPALTPSASLQRPRSPAATPSAEYQPPVDDGPSMPLSPAAQARIDLARRLRIDSDRIDVVNVTARELDEAVISCLTRGGGSEKLWADLEEVQWITLAVKDKVHHYVALDELVIYCDE